MRLPQISWRAIRVWQRNWDTYTSLSIYPASLVGNLGEPILYLLAMGYGLGRYVPPLEGWSYAAFIGSGIVASSSMFTACFECTFGSFTRMQEQRTFDGMITTPLSMDDVTGGEILWGATKTLITGSCILAVLSFFGIVRTPLALLVLGLVFLEGVAFSAISLVGTALSPGYWFFNYFFTLLITPMFLFSGVFFPLSQLPDWARAISWFMPLTHFVAPARALVLQAPWPHPIADSLWIIGCCIAFSFLAMILLRRRLIR